MKIETKLEGTTFTVAPEGRIDTLTSPEFEKALVLDGVTDLVIDLEKVDYISSAGLRVFVRASKRLGEGRVAIVRASPFVREVFDVVGFADAFVFR